MKKIISIGCDHAGYSLKLEIKKQLVNLGYEVLDMGCYSEESIDYPDYAHPVADYVETNTDAKGILICGSGNGINMAANKHQGIRSALCWQVEIAKLAREHNNANIVALPARFISSEEALKIVEAFLNTPFEGGRHQKRVDKIACV
ncbi:MAG: ribose 5-phosphate isomerase B [Bacteroidetes bacterium]|nr:ribose 5-phosphate isomerase B [Bacteroidota bacterium]